MMSHSNPRIPISSPDFRYQVSRNPYQHKLKDLAGRDYVDGETEDHREQWRSLFPDAAQRGTQRPLMVEIGCNGGHVILELAAKNPEMAHIGIDWKYKQIHRGADKAKSRGIENLLFFRAHAERMKYIFGPGEIDLLCVFFPDPWPK